MDIMMTYMRESCNVAGAKSVGLYRPRTSKPDTNGIYGRVVKRKTYEGS